MTTLTADEAIKTTWDVAIVGTGIGGGIIGRRLAEAGHSVLFIEKGSMGRPAEATENSYTHPDPQARLLRGLWPAKLKGLVNGKPRHWFGPIGCGVGGSSVFYAAALERPRRHDIDAVEGTAHPTNGWPVDFDTYLPYYDQAASMFYLNGSPDPLDDAPALPLLPPRALTDSDEALMQSLTKAGCHPYRLNLATKNRPGCRGCVGHKCPQACKLDGRSAGVNPALATGKARILVSTAVTEILHENGTVAGLRSVQREQEHTIKAKTYILAAGALASPRLLMASGDAANSSGLVGRGLLFHLNEMFALWPKTRAAGGVSKSIGLRDIYGGQDRFGAIQSLGLEADYDRINTFLGQLYDRSFLGRFRQGRKFTAILASIASRLLGSAPIFVGFVEDYPLAENRVLPPVPNNDQIEFTYNVPKTLRTRRRAFRRAIRKKLKGHRVLFLHPDPEPNFGHPAATLRFGTSEKNSVLNPDCRTHDLNNLYVVDASFMPSSLGVNPSLTIAANALRVGDIISKKMLNSSGPS